MGNCCCPDKDPYQPVNQQQTQPQQGNKLGTNNNNSMADNDEVRRKMLEAAEARRAKNSTGNLREVGYHKSGNNNNKPNPTTSNPTLHKEQEVFPKTNSTSTNIVENNSISSMPQQQPSYGGTNTNNNVQPTPSVGGMEGQRTTSASGLTPEEESNPVLRAAMLRRQASGQTTAHAANASPEEQEKQRLLNEIRGELKRQQKEEPFGLPASDKTKLRMFLNHLKKTQ